MENRYSVLFLKGCTDTGVYIFKVISSIMDSGGIYDTPSGAIIYTYAIEKEEWEIGLLINKYGFVINLSEGSYFADIVSYDEQNEILVVKGRKPGTKLKIIKIKEIKSIYKVNERCF